MTAVYVMLSFFLILLLISLIMFIFIEPVFIADDEEETVTTTTTTTVTDNPPAVQEWVTVGNLPRFSAGSDGPSQTQYYVQDPVDGAKWYVNATDDMYEDANGKFWRIV